MFKIFIELESKAGAFCELLDNREVSKAFNTSWQRQVCGETFVTVGSLAPRRLSVSGKHPSLWSAAGFLCGLRS